MARIYELIAYFLIGVGSTGTISYIIRITPKLHRAGIGLIILIALSLLLLLLLDDAIKNYLKTNYYNYILFLVGIAFVLLAGGVLQWL